MPGEREPESSQDYRLRNQLVLYVTYEGILHSTCAGPFYQEKKVLSFDFSLSLQLHGVE